MPQAPVSFYSSQGSSEVTGAPLADFSPYFSRNLVHNVSASLFSGIAVYFAYPYLLRLANVNTDFLTAMSSIMFLGQLTMRTALAILMMAGTFTSGLVQNMWSPWLAALPLTPLMKSAAVSSFLIYPIAYILSPGILTSASSPFPWYFLLGTIAAADFVGLSIWEFVGPMINMKM